jgi:hypothetical protein
VGTVRRTLTLALLLALACAATASAQTLPLRGPAGSSLDKVLVIGTDGTRWDKVEAAIKAGAAPNLSELAGEGFGRPSLLEYPPGTFTISEVGWSTIASGVWPGKHGVSGVRFNNDPKQATKNGYLDFLTRIEQERARASTFYAGDWDNLGLPLHGGPIFGTAMDVNYSARVATESLAAWNLGDVQVADAAAHYLKYQDPDASFVYLGLVDESAHLAGSETPTYADAIRLTDGRIGRLLDAVRSRPSYPFESWTVLVTTDHGQRPLSEPSPLSHYTDTPLERTSFVVGTGPGLGANVTQPHVVDILPTVLHQLGLPVPAAWNLDGKSLSSAKPPSSASAKVRGGRLSVRLSLGAAPSGARSILFRLPRGARTGEEVGVLRVDGRRVDTLKRFGRRSLTARLSGAPLHSVSLTQDVSGRPDGALTIGLRGRTQRIGKLELGL